MKWLVAHPRTEDPMGMASSGRRNKLGGLHGPMHQQDVNGTHPAMLGAQRFNSDVQLPYRFPIVAETHCCEDQTCVGNIFDKDIIQGVQFSQDAQAG